MVSALRRRRGRRDEDVLLLDLDHVADVEDGRVVHHHRGRTRGQGAAVVHGVGTGPVVVVGHQELRRAGGQLGEPRGQRGPVHEPVDRDAEDVVGDDPGVERRELGQGTTFVQRHVRSSLKLPVASCKLRAASGRTRRGPGAVISCLHWQLATDNWQLLADGTQAERLVLGLPVPPVGDDRVEGTGLGGLQGRGRAGAVASPPRPATDGAKKIANCGGVEPLAEHLGRGAAAGLLPDHAAPRRRRAWSRSRPGGAGGPWRPSPPSARGSRRRTSGRGRLPRWPCSCARRGPAARAGCSGSGPRRASAPRPCAAGPGPPRSAPSRPGPAAARPPWIPGPPAGPSGTRRVASPATAAGGTPRPSGGPSAGRMPARPGPGSGRAKSAWTPPGRGRCRTGAWRSDGECCLIAHGSAPFPGVSGSGSAASAGEWPEPGGTGVKVVLDLGVEPGVLLVLQAGEHQPDQLPQELALGFRRIARRGQDGLELGDGPGQLLGGEEVELGGVVDP